MVSRVRCVWLAAAIVCAVASAAALSAQEKLDITGAWIFTVTTDAGSGTPTVTFKQDGDKITGHYSSDNLGEADLSGTLKGQDLTFTFTANAQGTQVPVTYTGTVQSEDAMKGTLDIAGLAQGTFTAKRK